MAARNDDGLERMRAICLALPDTKETMTWGKPHFRVGEKIFAGYGEEKGKATIGFKLEMEHAEERVRRDPRFERAPYVGHKGWVSMDAAAVRDWEEVDALVRESYRLIAPKRSLAKLSEPGTLPSRPKRPGSPSTPAKAARRKK